MKASQLRPHPRNWREHPPAQRDAMRGMLAEIGLADALLARELEDGSLELIDGHLRAELTAEADVPVLVLDLDENEAAKLLALLDPLAGLAETNTDVLAELLADVATENESVQGVLDGLLKDSAPAWPSPAPAEEPLIPESFQIVVDCRDEAQQRELFERFQTEGLSCRLLTI
ncbi:MAG: ParB N-terminal domain-containing protein [Pirellulales bacterium]|nr:ParB N-terminal domain-containing protein [Pirellulales bacterium]